jgi:flagellar assembly protein FliH
MTGKLISGLISAENASNATSWILPPVSDSGKILSSAEKEARERREKLLRQSKEKIEDLDVKINAKAGISAKEMQAMYDTVEKDGFSQGKDAGFQQGKAEGYEAGHQQGLIEMQAQLAIEKQKYLQKINALMDPIRAQDDDLENMLLDVICTLTQTVLERELTLDSSQILALVKKSIAALPVGSKNIRIYLHANDVKELEPYVAEHQLDWVLNVDSDMLPGGCRIETPESRVDYSVSMRLRNVLQQFLTGQLATSTEK